MDEMKKGDHYGYWTVMIAYDNKHPAKDFCRCICGKEKWVNRYSLRSGLSKSCGCKINRYTKDYGIKSGDKIGHWTVLRRGDSKNESKAYFLCRCICGKERWVAAHTLINGTSLSCGCKRTDGDSPALVDGRKISVAVRKQHIDTKYAGFGRKENKNNATGVTGVSLAKGGQYRAYIYVNRKQIYLGVFDTLEEAAKSRHEAEIKYFSLRQKMADEIKDKIKKDNSK